MVVGPVNRARLPEVIRWLPVHHCRGGPGNRDRSLSLLQYAALAPLVHARGMLMSPNTALLVALASLALSASTGDICAAVGAVTLATVAVAAHQDLALASYA